MKKLMNGGVIVIVLIAILLGFSGCDLDTIVGSAGSESDTNKLADLSTLSEDDYLQLAAELFFVTGSIMNDIDPWPESSLDEDNNVEYNTSSSGTVNLKAFEDEEFLVDFEFITNETKYTADLQSSGILYKRVEVSTVFIFNELKGFAAPVKCKIDMVITGDGTSEGEADSSYTIFMNEKDVTELLELMIGEMSGKSLPESELK